LAVLPGLGPGSGGREQAISSSPTGTGHLSLNEWLFPALNGGGVAQQQRNPLLLFLFLGLFLLRRAQRALRPAPLLR
jgi:hypothetical protein